MSQRSSLKSLPEAILAQVNFMVSDGGWTIDDIVGYLSEAGHPRSRSAVGRYKARIDRMGARMRESREITEALASELGESAMEGQQGRLLVQIGRNLVLEMMDRLDGESEFTPRDAAFLGKGLAEFSRALRLNQDYEAKLRERIAKEHAAQLDGALQAAEADGEKGLSAERVAQLRRDFLGVRETEGGAA